MPLGAVPPSTKRPTPATARWLCRKMYSYTGSRTWPQWPSALMADESTQMRQWIERAKHCEFGAGGRFAYGLQRDISAVAAAVDNSWSTGQVEGQINRLKMIKRQMYGRAGFELLRARVLPYSPAASA